MALSNEILNIVVCPKCKKDIEYQAEQERFICHHCALTYPIVNDIPNFLLDQAQPLNKPALDKPE